MGVVFFRTKVGTYKKDKFVQLSKPKYKGYYRIMEIKEEDIFLSQYYTSLIKHKKSKPCSFGLAEYLSKDYNKELYGKVLVIDYRMYYNYLLFRCEGNFDDKDDFLTSKLKDYILDQISDGAWENGIYILKGYIGDPVKHCIVESELEQVIFHPYKKDSNGEFQCVVGNNKMLDSIIEEYIKGIEKNLGEEINNG